MRSEGDQIAPTLTGAQRFDRFAQTPSQIVDAVISQVRSCIEQDSIQGTASNSPSVFLHVTHRSKITLAHPTFSNNHTLLSLFHFGELDHVRPMTTVKG